MSRHLTEEAVDEFRSELCRVAARRFAQFGHAGITLRALAQDLGCIRSRPYRYFNDKQQILGAVRSEGFLLLARVLEAAASADVGIASVMGAFNFSGDAEDSFWVQASLPLSALSSDDVEVGLTVGAGNGVYTTDTDPNLVQVSLDVSSGDYFAQYILNPEAEIEDPQLTLDFGAERSHR